MLTKVPNHPEGVIRPDYRGRFWVREELDGIDVIRVWVKTAPVKTMRTRLAFYLSFMLNAALAGLLLARGRYDVLYATSPPLFVGGAALALSYLRRTPLVFEVRDLWPESAIALGELTNPLFIHLATLLEEACYRRAKRIVLTTNEMVDYLLGRGYDGVKLKVVRNGANPDLFQFNSEARQRIRKELELADCFVVVYAGLLGIAQGLGTSLEAAAQIMKLEQAVHFLFIGDGPVRTKLIEQTQALELDNVTFLPAQPRKNIPDYPSAGDAALVPLIRQRLVGALPSKMFDAMACERPVILAAEGESCQVLDETNAGIIIPPQDASALVESILHLSSTPDLCRYYGKNGREAVVKHYSRQAQARILVTLLEEVL